MPGAVLAVAALIVSLQGTDSDLFGSVATLLAFALPFTTYPSGWLGILALPQASRTRGRPPPPALLVWVRVVLLSAALSCMPQLAAAPLPPLMLLGARWALRQEGARLPCKKAVAVMAPAVAGAVLIAAIACIAV